jgi:hypothetical protein
MTTRTGFQVILALLAAGRFAEPAAGQGRGFPQNCHGVFTASIASGLPHANLRNCAPYVVSEVASAVGAAPSPDNASRLVSLAGYAAFFRDPTIFDASMAVAADPAASSAARKFGLALALDQIEPETAIVSENDARCVLVFLGPRQWWVDNGISASAHTRLRDLVRSMGAGGGGNTAPRGIAECVEQVLDVAEEAPSVERQISARYICETNFEITNGADHSVELQYRVVGTSETGPLNLRSHETALLITDEVGQIELTSGGTVVASAHNDARQCSAP